MAITYRIAKGSPLTFVQTDENFNWLTYNMSGSIVYLSGSIKMSGSLIQGASSNVASGDYSHAEGSGTTATGDYSHAEGYNTTAEGNRSHAEGEIGSLASGRSSHAEGEGTEARGIGSHAEGTFTLASGQGSHAEGYLATASGNRSHAEGHKSFANAYASHAAGKGTFTDGQNYSYVGGLQTTASDYYGTYVGEFNENINEEPGAQTLFQVGSGVSHAKRSNSFTVGYSGSTEAGTHYPFIILPCEDSDGSNITTASYAASGVGFPKGTMIVQFGIDPPKLFIKSGTKYWYSASLGQVIDP